MNLIINSREKIGIIGRTGSGKSLIFQALFRLRDTSTVNGQILIDGIDIHTIRLADLRSKINIIPQSPVLFQNTLRYNLDPLERFTDEQLWNILEVVQLKTFTQQLEHGLYTHIDESAINFSIGQSQLLCLARELLKQTKIILIDELTARIDVGTEKIIQQILRERFVKQTLLTITHRLNTVRHNDKVLVLDKGNILKYQNPIELFLIPYQEPIVIRL